MRKTKLKIKFPSLLKGETLILPCENELITKTEERKKA